MKNRIYLIGAILLVMALVFTGCPEPDNGGEDEPTTYTVTFNLNYAEATGAPDALTEVESGAKITAPTAPTREFYTFAGWYKETGCTNAWDFNTDTVTASITLYAKWTQSAGQAALALEAVLDDIDGEAASVSDTTVTLTKSIEINDLTVPAGVTLATGSYTLTVATNKALTIAGDLDTTGGTIAGAGTVSTTGAGKINTDYTATGATASEVGAAINALETDAAKLTDSTMDFSAFGGGSEDSGIGSVTLEDVNATAVNDDPTYASGSAIELDANTTFAGTAVIVLTGTHSADVSEIVAGSLTLESGALKLVDSGYAEDDEKVAIAEFTGIKLENSGVTTADALPAFHIGITTSRDDG
jgi:uncharacterized repeat protein (TIGR02543 family)